MTDVRKPSSHCTQLLERMRLPLCAFAALALLATIGILMFRATLLENAYDTGTALSRSCAAEGMGNLAVYETLLTFGTDSLDRLAADGGDQAEVEAWLDLYFQRLDAVLGDGVVDPYVVWDGEILAANPWEGDATYDAASSPWYQQAVAAQGEVIFTHVYTDAIYQRPVITAAQQCPLSGAVMAFDILPEHLRFEATYLKEGDSFFLCDSVGTIIYQETDLKLPREELQAYLTNLVGRINDGALEEDPSIRDLDGRQRGVYYTRMDNGWYSIITIPYRRVLGNLWGFTWSLLLMFVISFLALAILTRRELRLDARVKRANETVQVLGNTYYAVYRVDYERETYEMVKGSDYVRKQIPPTGPYEDLLRTAGEVIEEEAFRDFTESFSCENIRKLVQRRVRDFGGEFLRRFGEEYRWVSVRVLYDASLASGEVVLCFREVEEEKQNQLRQRRLLEESLQLARQNEASKQAFFRSMSHDMRTPLNAILGMTELAKQRLDDSNALVHCLEKIQSSGKFLLELINDILDMSRMEQGKLTLDNRRFDLRDCVEECLGNFRLQAQEEGKTLECTFQVEDTLLMGDDFRVRQILNNLLSNGVKFTPKGGRISLTVEQVQVGDVAQYRFVVSDTGIGMSPEFLQRLFEPYAREMRFSAQQAAGTGLGMAITKNLVSQMEGEIHVESTPGEGTTFTVLLPFAVLREPEKADASSKTQTVFTLQGLRVLLAEDNELNREIASEMLETLGVIVTQAVDGQEAVERFEESTPGDFDAILMDMQMPRLDGCGAARAIRALDRADAKTVPIIAVTANAFSEDVAATAAAGMNAHVTKPIDYGQLEQLLKKLCSEAK